MNYAMTKGQTMPKELVDQLAATFQERASIQGLKGKKRVAYEAEYFVGAVRAIDLLLGNDETSCLPPSVWIAIIRGESLTPNTK
jgi:hypothetical protein